MLPTKPGASWVSAVYNQGAGETDWTSCIAELKTELRPVPFTHKNYFIASPDDTDFLIHKWDDTYEVKNVSELTAYTGEHFNTKAFVNESKAYNLGSTYTGLQGNNTFISTSGTLFFSAGSSTVYGFTLGTAFDISTLTITGMTTNAMGIGTISAICFSLDGLKFWATSGSTLYEWTLSTAFNLSTRGAATSSSLSGVFSSNTIVGVTSAGDFLYCSDGSSYVAQYRLSGGSISGMTLVYSASQSTLLGQSSLKLVRISADGQMALWCGNTSLAVMYLAPLRKPFDLSSMYLNNAGYTGVPAYTYYACVSHDFSRIYLRTASPADYTVRQYRFGNAAMLASDNSNGAYVLPGGLNDPTAIWVSRDASKIAIMYQSSTGSSYNALALYDLRMSGGLTFDNYTGISYNVENFASYNSASFICFSELGDLFFTRSAYHSYGVNVYKLPTAWSMSTAPRWVFTWYPPSLTASADATGLCFSPDGLRCYVIASDNYLYQYDLRLPFDVSTATYVRRVAVVSNGHLSISDDGRVIRWHVGNSAHIRIGAMTTAWDISTATFSDRILNQNVGGPYGAVHSDALRGWLIGGQSSDGIFALTDGYPESGVRYALSDANPPRGVYVLPNELRLSLKPTSSRHNTLPQTMTASSVVGTTVVLPYDNTVDQLLSVGDKVRVTDPTTAPSFLHVDTSGVSNTSWNSNHSGVFISPSGHRLYAFVSGGTIEEYSMSTPGDLSTLSWLDSYTPIGSTVAFTMSADGTKLYQTRSSDTNIYQYTLSTAWDLTTISYTKSMSMDISSAGGICFNQDGTRLLLCSSSYYYIYYLSTPWDIATRGYSATMTGPTANFYRPLEWRSDLGLVVFAGSSSLQGLVMFSLNATTGAGAMLCRIMPKSNVSGFTATTYAQASWYSFALNKSYHWNSTVYELYEAAGAVPTFTKSFTIQDISVASGQTTLTLNASAAGYTVFQLPAAAPLVPQGASGRTDIAFNLVYAEVIKDARSLQASLTNKYGRQNVTNVKFNLWKEP